MLLSTLKYFKVLLSIFFILPAIYSSGNGTMNSESLEWHLQTARGVSVTSLGIVLAARPERCREM